MKCLKVRSITEEVERIDNINKLKTHIYIINQMDVDLVCKYATLLITSV